MPCTQRASSSRICMASVAVRRPAPRGITQRPSDPLANLASARGYSVAVIRFGSGCWLGMAASGPDAAVRSDAGLARADDQQAVHLDGCRVEVGEGGGRQALARTADVATDDDRGCRMAVLQQDPSCRADLITPTS